MSKAIRQADDQHLLRARIRKRVWWRYKEVAKDETERSGRKVSVSDLVRAALTNYLRVHEATVQVRAVINRAQLAREGAILVREPGLQLPEGWTPCPHCGEEGPSHDLPAPCYWCGEIKAPADWSDCLACGTSSPLPQKPDTMCPSCGESKVPEDWTECPSCGVHGPPALTEPVSCEACGVTKNPQEPHATCTKCGHYGPVTQDFGWRRPRKTGSPIKQPQCKKCRAEASRRARLRKKLAQDAQEGSELIDQLEAGGVLDAS